jgi:hypothetical protein
MPRSERQPIQMKTVLRLQATRRTRRDEEILAATIAYPGDRTITPRQVTVVPGSFLVCTGKENLISMRVPRFTGSSASNKTPDLLILTVVPSRHSLSPRIR